MVGVPGDIKLWWNVVIPAIGATIPGFFAFAQSASWWVVALLTLGVFVALFLVSIPAERAITSWRNNKHTAINSEQSENSIASTNSEQPVSGRTGIRSKRLQGRGKNWKISNQETGIDSEDADLDVDDMDIK